MDAFANIVKYSNKKILRQGKGKQFGPVDLFKYLGIKLTMAIVGGCTKVEDYFKVRSDENTVFQAQDYKKKYGMSYEEFLNIHSNFTLADIDAKELKTVIFLFIWLNFKFLGHMFMDNKFYI